MSETVMPLGPGDPDPRSPAAVMPEAAPPLGPGDDDPRSPAGTALAVAPPLGPGEAAPGDGGDEDLVMLTPAPPGPGGAERGPLHVTHIPRKRATPATPPVSTQPDPIVVDAALAADEEQK